MQPTSTCLVVSTIVLGVMPVLASGQTTVGAGTPSESVRSAIKAAAGTAQISAPPATLMFANRPIVELRATVLSRTPSERAAAAGRAIDRVVSETPTAGVTTHALDEGVLFSIGDHPVFGLVREDTDPLAGERLDLKAREAGARLHLAIRDAVELRDPVRLLTAVGLALAATAAWVGLLWLLRRLHARASARLSRTAERQLERLPGGAIIATASNAPRMVGHAFTLALACAGLLVTYAWLTFTLRQFPYTRPVGESLRSELLAVLWSLGGEFVQALPNLLTVVAILVLTRFVARLVTLLFDAAEQGHLAIPGVYPETAQPTRRIGVALLWVCALLVSYRYLPGSDSDAFKGISILVGLMVSLGSSGIMNQVMSGLTLTYSRALKKNDFVRIGDLEGTVTHLGALSAKIKTVRNEEITIPNAVVVAQATTNYSPHGGTDGVWTPTAVTIGYDVPWRQVQALLLLAAERTPGLQPLRKPVVRQTALQDSAVQYTLLVCLDRPDRRGPVLDALHASIQDAFNEYGVQIMSPNYESDPSGPKVVPRDQWYAAPARSPIAAGESVGQR